MAIADFRDRPDLTLATDLALFSFMAYGMPFCIWLSDSKEYPRTSYSI